MIFVSCDILYLRRIIKLGERKKLYKKIRSLTFKYLVTIYHRIYIFPSTKNQRIGIQVSIKKLKKYIYKT